MLPSWPLRLAFSSCARPRASVSPACRGTMRSAAPAPACLLMRSRTSSAAGDAPSVIGTSLATCLPI